MLTRCMSVIAHVQEAVLIRDHAPGVFLAHHKKLQLVKVAHGDALRGGRPAIEEAPEFYPGGVHELVWPQIVPNIGQVAKLAGDKNANFSWPLICKNCRARTTSTHNWAGLSRTVSLHGEPTDDEMGA